MKDKMRRGERASGAGARLLAKKGTRPTGLAVEHEETGWLCHLMMNDVLTGKRKLG